MLTTWRTLHEFLLIHEDLRHHPSQNGIEIACWSNLICYLFVFCENCLNYLNSFCPPMNLASYWHDHDFLLKRKPSRNPPLHGDPYVPNCFDHIWAQHYPEMNLFRCMKTRALDYTTMLCPISVTQIHSCCAWRNDITPYHDRYHLLNLNFNAPRLITNTYVFLLLKRNH